MSRIRLSTAILFAATLAALPGQQPAATSITIEGKNVAAKYTPAPLKSGKAAGTFHTDADLVFKGTVIPKGDYSLSVLTEGDSPKLVFTKSGAKAETGRVAMSATKSTAAAASTKMVLTKTAARAGKLEVSWESTSASTAFHLDRVAGDSEW